MGKTEKSNDTYVVSIQVEGFMPLDPGDPENLDRKHPDPRDPRDVMHSKVSHREQAEEQRKVLVAQAEDIAKGKGLELVDKEIRDDGTGILRFRFDPKNEVEYRLERDDVEKGATTWDATLRNHVEEARSSLVGTGLQVNEVKIDTWSEAQREGPSKQESQRQSDEPTPTEVKEAKRQPSKQDSETPKSGKRS